MLTRRAFVGKLAASTAVVSTASVALAKTIAPRGKLLPADAGTGEGSAAGLAADASAAEAAAAPVDNLVPGAESVPPRWDLVRPLAVGSVVAHGWRVADLTGVVDGSCVLTLQNAQGRAHRVHLCRNDGQPQGLVYTERFDLVVMNGGRGDLPTEEGFAQAVAAVAHVLAANERDRQQQDVVAALLPHRERLTRFTAVADARLR